MKKIFPGLFFPIQFENEDDSRIARFLYVIILAIIFIASLVGITDALAGVPATLYVMFAFIAPMGVALWLLQRKKLAQAGYLVIFTATLGVTLVLSVGQGIHDIGLMDYTLILLVSTFVLNRRGVMLVTGLIIVSLAVVVFGEMYQILPVKNAPEYFLPRTADFIIVSLTIVLGSITVNMLGQTLKSALQKARQSEARLKSLLDQAPDLIVILDANFMISFTNLVVDTAPNAYTGKSVFDFLQASYHNKARDVLESTLGGAQSTWEIPLFHPNKKEWRWHSVRVGPLKQPDTSANGIMIIATDIQDKKNTEKELQESRHMLLKRAEQLAMLHEIGKTITSLQDLDGALRNILEQMKVILPLDVFVVALYEPVTRQVTFPLVYDDEQVWDEKPRELPQGSYIAQTIQTRQPILVNRPRQDVMRDVRRREERLGARDRISASIMAAPLLAHEQVIGAISIHSYSFDTYTSEHLDIAGQAANLIAIAIENARLYDTSILRAEQLETLNEISKAISNLRDVEGVLDTAYIQLKNILPIDTFFIALYDSQTRLITFPLLTDAGKRYEREPSPIQPETMLAEVIETRRPVLVNRTAEKIAALQAEEAEKVSRLADINQVSASLMMAPLQAAGRILGAVSVQSYQLDSYDTDDLTLLLGAANQIAIAIENARLYSQLQTELTERKRAEAEVRKLNAELENRVHQRTAELESVNKELSSFTYTLSHDLRAPLRGIHGLSHILLEEHGDSLSQEAHNYIDRIQGNARNMGHLIDDLLTYTHLSRQPLFKVNIDMNELVQAVFNDVSMKSRHPVELSVNPLPEAYADLALVRQVVHDLVSNAFKFTSKTHTARLEIGSLADNGEIAYYFKDNGAGFDMAYASKLFGVFQRLHHENEFEGTGMGLAIAKRIIQKHDGRIWAEGRVGYGATLFFTLPQRS